MNSSSRDMSPNADAATAIEPLPSASLAFVGMDPKLLERGGYVYRPTPNGHFFLEIELDGHRIRIDVGEIGRNCFDGVRRRGVHINFPIGADLGDLSTNALNLSMPEWPLLWRSVTPEAEGRRKLIPGDGAA
jgi:hypothetical protein